MCTTADPTSVSSHSLHKTITVTRYVRQPHRACGRPILQALEPLINWDLEEEKEIIRQLKKKKAKIIMQLKYEGKKEAKIIMQHKLEELGRQREELKQGVVLTALAKLIHRHASKESKG